MKRLIPFLIGAFVATFFYWLIDNNLYEYHFNVDGKGYEVYSDHLKYIGTLHYGSCPGLDSLIDNDNQ